MARRKRRYRRQNNKRTWWLAIILVVIAGCFMWSPVKKWVKRHIHPTSRTTIVDSKEYNGIDVSKYQGNINWDKVAQDQRIQFVYIKASEGATRVDQKYSDNIRKARKAGLKVGSYHYFIGRKSAREQFLNFNKYVVRSQQDLIPMVDVEELGNRTISRRELQRNLMEFMELVKDEYGKYPLLYSQYGFYNKQLAPEFNRFYIFIARYGKREPILKGGGKYNIWQFTEKGHIDGIRTTVDLNRFANGTDLDDIEL